MKTEGTKKREKERGERRSNRGREVKKKEEGERERGSNRGRERE